MSAIPCPSSTSRQFRPDRRPSAWEARISRETAPLWILIARSGREPLGSSSASDASTAASRYHAAFDFAALRTLEQARLIRKLGERQGSVMHRLGLELLFQARAATAGLPAAVLTRS